MLGQFRCNFKNVIFIMYSILPIVDSINGILSVNKLPSLGVAYKIVMLFLIFCYLVQKKEYIIFMFQQRSSVLACFFVAYVLFSVGINLLITNGIGIEITYPIKLIYNVVLFFSLWGCLKLELFDLEYVRKVFRNNIIAILICVLLPYFLGIGQSIYSGSIGYKAFYYSQNELSAILLLLLFFSLSESFQPMKLKMIIQFVGLCFCILIMNTKTGLIAGAVGFLLFLYLLAREIGTKVNFRHVLKTKKNKVCFAGTTIICIIGIYIFFREQISNVFMRQMTLLNHYEGDLLAVLTSGRIYYLEKVLGKLENSPYKILNMIIGNGFVSNDLIEMDFFDIYIFLGWVGVVFIILFFVWHTKKSLSTLKKDKTHALFFGYILILSFSFIAGHVLFMTTSGPYFCLFLVYIMFVQDNNLQRDMQI